MSMARMPASPTATTPELRLNEPVPESGPTYREAVLERDRRRCVKCGEASSLHVHHLVPRKLGGTDEHSNLITLCGGCHAAIHPNLQGGLARRLIESWAFRLARLFDSSGSMSERSRALGRGLRALGLTAFRAGQFEVVEAALQGDSLLAIRPTGSGKSACFQVPAVMTPGLAVVVSPLKALMADQVSGLSARQIPASFLNGDLSPDERNQRLRLLERGMFKLLYLAPERFFLARPGEIERLRRLRPSYLVVDEAHCIDRWGRDFRPEYGRLREVREALGNPPVLAFTATAGTKTQDRILSSLGIASARRFIQGVDRRNITILRRESPEPSRYQEIAELLRRAEELDHRAMVFVPTVKIGNRLKESLAKLGLPTEFFHSKMGSASEREFLLGRFVGRIEPPLRRIICTNAFGMGIDIPDVRIVVHWQHPASAEDYLQEFGRAGRDGKPAVAILLRDPQGTGLRLGETKSYGLLKFMAERTVSNSRVHPGDRPELLESKLDAVREMQRIAYSKRCPREGFRHYFEGRQAEEKRSLGFRFFRWWMSEKEKVRTARYCCDAHLSASDRKLPLAEMLERVLSARSR